MSNTFAFLPNPAGPADGVGATVDLSSMASSKTLLVSGAFECTVTIEISNDGVNFASLYSFTTPDNYTLDAPCTSARVRLSGYVSGTPIVHIGAAEAIVTSAALNVTAGNGSGTVLNIAQYGEQKSLVCTGIGFTGSVDIEISGDGTNFVSVFTFQTVSQHYLLNTASFMRVTRRGVDGGPTPVVALVGITGIDEGAVSAGLGVITTPTNIIYARSTGSDTSGTGTLTNPYRTFARAWQDVPSRIAPTRMYTVDITGIGVEVLPNNFTAGPIDTWQANIVATSGTWYTDIYPLNVIALPQLVAALTVPDATFVVPTDIASQVLDPDTQQLTVTLNVARASWAADALKTKFVMIDTLTSAINAPVQGSTNLTLVLTRNAVLPNGTYTLRECSATLQCNEPTIGYSAHFNNIQTLMFAGIKFTNAVANSQSLEIQGCLQPLLELCDVQGYRVYNSSPLAPTARSTVFRDRAVTADGPSGGGLGEFIKCLFTGVSFSPRNGTTYFNQCTFQSITNRIGTGVTGGLSTGYCPSAIIFNSCLIDGSTNQGVEIVGGFARFVNTKISNCQSDGLLVDKANGFVSIGRLAGSGNGASGTGYGINVQDGAVVKVDDNNTLITGASGDMKVGPTRPTRTWADFRANPPLKQEWDLDTTAATAVLGTGSHLFQP